MRYAQIRSMDVSNGEGVGVALFVQGCRLHCKNCFNPETWDPSGGKPWTEDDSERFFSLVSRDFIKRVSFLGGEPLITENYKEVVRMMKAIKALYPSKRIWLYSGFDWNYILKNRQEILPFVDVAVLGPYIDELKDIGNRQTKWAGSTNQQVIDVQKSLSEGTIVLYEPN